MVKALKLLGLVKSTALLSGKNVEEAEQKKTKKLQLPFQGKNPGNTCVLETYAAAAETCPLLVR